MAIELGLWCAVVLVVVTRCRCQEDVLVPEAALVPRNFNPHPYQAGYEGRIPKFGLDGGLPFPLSSRLTQKHLPVGKLEKAFQAHEADDHPYIILSKRKKYKEAGRFQLEDNSSAPAAYKALAEYAAKVLRVPPIGRLAATYPNPNYSDQSKSYSFAYSVNQDNGDQFSHEQLRDSAGTKGEYRVKLPDGRVQIVSYTANDSGYNANVKYSDGPTAKLAPAPSISYVQENDIESIVQPDGSDANSQFLLARQSPSFDLVKEKVKHIIRGAATVAIPTMATYSIIPSASYVNIGSTTPLPRLHHSNLQMASFGSLGEYLLKY